MSKMAEVGSDGSGSRFDRVVIGDIDRHKARVDTFGCERGSGFVAGCLVADSQQ